MTLPFEKYEEIIKSTPNIRRVGVVTESRGLLVESKGPRASIGEIYRIEFGEGTKVLPK